jgi:hypothetical protein
VSLHFCDSSILRFYIGYQQTCDLLPGAWMFLYRCILRTPNTPKVTQGLGRSFNAVDTESAGYGGIAPSLKPEDKSSANVFWIRRVPWAISFLLPAARYQDWGQEKTSACSLRSD